MFEILGMKNNSRCSNMNIDLDDDHQGTVHLKKKIDILRTEMWKKLQHNGGYFGLLINCTNLYVQYGVIKNPRTDQ